MDTQAQLNQILVDASTNPPAYTTGDKRPPPSDLKKLVEEHRLRTTRTIMYALQAVDAEESARSLRLGATETNFRLKPFSHGGTPMMLAGFAAWDLVSGFVQRRWPTRLKTAVDAGQTASNVAGLLQTEAAIGLRNAYARDADAAVSGVQQIPRNPTPY
jgi:hypothetical protein